MSIFPKIFPPLLERTEWTLIPSIVAPRIKSPLIPNSTLALMVTPCPSAEMVELEGASAKEALILTGVLFPYF